MILRMIGIVLVAVLVVLVIGVAASLVISGRDDEPEVYWTDYTKGEGDHDKV